MKLSTCGNSCDTCKAYKANIEKCDEREALSNAWKKYLGFEIKPEDIHCDGGPCCAVELGFVHEGCLYKKCTVLHNVKHCGECSEYPCAESDDKRNINEQAMREKLGNEFDPDEFEKYVKLFDNQYWLHGFKKEERKRMGVTMCGYRCDLCKAFAPNIRKRDQRSELSAMWKKYYDLDIKPEDIYCEGCRNMNPDAKRVDMGCPVRPCVMEKGVTHCGECDSYPCVKWENRRGLTCEVAHHKLGGDFDASEYSDYIEAYDNGTRLDKFKKEKNL